MCVSEYMIQTYEETYMFQMLNYGGRVTLSIIKWTNKKTKENEIHHYIQSQIYKQENKN